jgi:hypothetical protein
MAAAAGPDLPRFALLFVGFAALLLARSPFLFTRAVVEEGDTASNSILVEHATHFTQLVGNYSRMGFHHPGPVFQYVEALGQWLCYGVLGLVPTPWNGQAIAILLLNAALLALTIVIVCRGTPRPAWSLSVVTAAALLYLGTHPQLVSSIWPPYTYVAPYLLLLAAATSAATGATRDLWALALALGLLIHGHAEFLGLATLIAAMAVALLVRRQRGRALLGERRHLVVAGAVMAVFAVPIVIDLVLHWPGEFGKYLAYGGSPSPHGPSAAVAYVARVWSDGPFAVVVLALAAACAGWAYRWRRDDPYLRDALRFTLVAAGSYLLYVVFGIDSLNEIYIGRFMNAIPLFLLLVSVATVSRQEQVGRHPVGVGLAAGLVATATVLAAVAPALVNTHTELPDAPAAAAALAARTEPGQPVVLTLAPLDAWAEALPLALTAHRQGMRVCFADPTLALVASPEYVCTPEEQVHGLQVIVARRGIDPVGPTLVASLGRSLVWADS